MESVAEDECEHEVLEDLDPPELVEECLVFLFELVNEEAMIDFLKILMQEQLLILLQPQHPLLSLLPLLS